MLTPHHGPTRLLVGLVVFILPRGAAARAAVTGDGDQTVLVAAVAVCPPVLLPIAALLQLSMPRRTPPVALNALARLAQGHFLGFVVSVRVSCHGVTILFKGWWYEATKIGARYSLDLILINCLMVTHIHRNDLLVLNQQLQRDAVRQVD